MDLNSLDIFPPLYVSTDRSDSESEYMLTVPNTLTTQFERNVSCENDKILNPDIAKLYLNQSNLSLTSLSLRASSITLNSGCHNATSSV